MSTPTINDPRFPQLLEKLRDTEQKTRVQSVQTLEYYPGTLIVAPLIQTLSTDADTKVRLEAARALCRLKKDARVIEALLAALADKDAKVRILVAQELGKRGDPRAVEPLAALLHDSKKEVRRAGAESLAKLEHPGAVEQAMPQLAELDESAR